MRACAALLLVVLLGACMPPVRVSTAPPSPPSAVLTVENTLQIPVNVYVIVDGTARLLGQVGSNATRALPVFDVPAGARVTLRATRVDGSASYTRSAFVLDRESSWTLP